jgi:hypothetical protein
MLRPRILLGSCLSLVFATTMATQTRSVSHPVAAFEQLKALVGEWEGKNTRGIAVKLSYEVVAAGSVLMERLKPEGQSEMVTMYTLDDDRIVVTHFCSEGNQPIMQTAPITVANGRYEFNFVRVSGLKNTNDVHMVGLTVTIEDRDHLTQVWGVTGEGKSYSNTFHYTRRQ